MPPRPIAICLEDLGAAADAPRYLQCSVLVGDQPGLRLDAAGEVQWQPPRPLLELCVSADDQLLVFLPGQAVVSAALHREGRSLRVPAEKPVIAIDGDELEVGAPRYRIHVHGAAPAAPAPGQPADRPTPKGLDPRPRLDRKGG